MHCSREPVPGHATRTSPDELDLEVRLWRNTRLTMKQLKHMPLSLAGRKPKPSRPQEFRSSLRGRPRRAPRQVLLPWNGAKQAALPWTCVEAWADHHGGVQRTSPATTAGDKCQGHHYVGLLPQIGRQGVLQLVGVWSAGPSTVGYGQYLKTRETREIIDTGEQVENWYLV